MRLLLLVFVGPSICRRSSLAALVAQDAREPEWGVEQTVSSLSGVEACNLKDPFVLLFHPCESTLKASSFSRPRSVLRVFTVTYIRSEVTPRGIDAGKDVRTTSR